jgi:hypothetical protein
MKCEHTTCTCEVTADDPYCSDHCREHGAHGQSDTHPCECGHPGCGGA